MERDLSRHEVRLGSSVSVLNCPKGDYFDRVLSAGKFYEIEMLQYIRSLKLGGTYIDVGANLGNHTTFFSKHTVAKEVHSFEPMPSMIELLKMNCLDNVLTNVTIHEVALGDFNGTETIGSVSDANCGTASILRTPGGTEIQVTTLDSFDFHGVTMIKIDVEGYEASVLRGAANTIRENRPNLFIECATDADLKAVTEIVVPLGYRNVAVFNYTPTYHFAPINRT